jgi:hypothetical protein
MIKKLFFVSFIGLVFVSCKQEAPKPKEKIATFANKILPEDIKTITPEEAQTYHKNPERKYEYRTGASNNYEYNYDIVGTDSLQNQVKGNINVEGKYGAGIIIDTEGKNVEVEVEWVDYGKLKGKDKNGKIYNLWVE